MFQPYKGRRAFEDIAAQIKRAILTERLGNGDRLPPERELAEQFQVGRVTIREAFRTLETMGLIEVKKGSGGGAFVRAADPEAMASMIMDRLQLEGTTHDQMIEARIGIESAVVGSVIRNATVEDLERLREDIENSKEVRLPEQSEETVAGMINFHILLAETSHNIPYKMFVRSMMQWAARMLKEWVPSEEEQRFSSQSHEQIFEAIEKRDVELGKQLIREHIESMGSLVLKRSKAVKQIRLSA